MNSWVEMFNVMNTALPIFFFVILGIILISAAGSLRKYFVNFRRPVLIVQSMVVSKRVEVSLRHMPDTAENRSETKYYITFELESGDRLEFSVDGKEYGQYVEGDEGLLTFKGDLFRGFERQSRSYRRMDHPEYPNYHRSSM